MEPKELKRMAESGINWVKKNPAQAALYGLAGGFAIGFLGAARLAIGVRTLAAVPGVANFVMDFANRAMNPEAEESDSTLDS